MLRSPATVLRHVRLPRILKTSSSISLSTTRQSSSSIVGRFFGQESNVASATFTNRWAMVVPAFVTHMCLGAPYAWSIMADQLTREIGFVAPAMADWSLGETALPMSIVFIMQGLCAAVAGKWQVSVGPRAAMGFAAVSFGGGFMLGALGIYFHSVPLLYAGYGAMGGTGIGLAYTPPVQTLMAWFPDKKGIASGLCIAGFGSGALVFSPLIQNLMKKFAKMPEYLGPLKDFTTKIVDGRLFADVNGKLIEVVAAGPTEIAKLPYDLAEGLYVVGSGSSGAAEALGVMGAAYFAAMLASALAFKKPHPSYVVAGLPAPTPGVVVNQGPDISVDKAMSTSQFYLLGTTLFCIGAGGLGLFSVAKTMMSDVFSKAVPTIATSAFAATFVLILSVGNLGGRLGWAAVSDTIGTRATFAIFTLGSIPLYLSVPYLVEMALVTGSAFPLYGFCISTALAISIFGGMYAVMPAYEADLFGAKNVGPIHGRMLLFSSAAALAGPKILLYLRGISEKTAVDDLVSKISPETFQSTFGAPIEMANELFAAKSLTISRLMSIAPPGTIDPTPHLYDSTMYTIAGMMAVATVAHALIRPTQKVVVNLAAASKAVDQTKVATVVTESLKSK